MYKYLVMRSLSLVFCFLFLSLAGMAQKRMVTNAILSQRDGDLENAKEAIDEAAAHEKTKNEAKTWYWRGKIYASLATSKDKDYQNVADQPGIKAVQYYRKAMELSKEGEEYYKDARKDLLETVWQYMINSGVEAYQANNFHGAAQKFYHAYLANPDDTTAYSFGANAAERAQMHDTARVFYEKALEAGFEKKKYYNNLVRIYSQINQEHEKALDVLNNAVKKYPDDYQLRKLQISIMLKTGKKEEALAKIKKVLEKNPENASLHFNIGVLYENQGNQEKAIESYNKAIKYDTTNYDAYYNLGAVYYNQAVQKYNKAHKMDMDEYKKKGKAIEAEGNKLLQKAIPYFEKAYAIKASQEVKDILSQAYTRLGNDEKAKKYETGGDE